MAFNGSRIRRAVGTAAVAAGCGLGLVLAPSVGHADPSDDKAAVQQQIIQTQHEISVVAEEYNDAKIQLAELNVAMTEAESALADAQVNLELEQAKVASAGASLYMGPMLADATVVLTASSPQEVVDKLALLGQISDHYGVTIKDLKAGQSHAATVAHTAEQAAAQAAATEQDLAAKKAQIESKLPALQAQLASLSADERQAVLAQAGGHAGSAPATVTPVNAGSGGSATAQAAVNAALSRLGMPYTWAASGPNSFDCSGLMKWAYSQAGVSLPHSSGAQSKSGTQLAVSAAAPGDILWMPGHVGMYIGNGQVVHAPTTGDVVKVVPVSSMSWKTAVRVA